MKEEGFRTDRGTWEGVRNKRVNGPKPLFLENKIYTIVYILFGMLLSA